MSITHESVVSMLVETLEAVDGAGSDLVTGWRSGEWLDIQGNLDLHHLASDILILVDQAKAEALREAADAFLDSGTIGCQWVARELNARASTIEG